MIEAMSEVRARKALREARAISAVRSARGFRVARDSTAERIDGSEFQTKGARAISCKSADVDMDD